MRCEAGGLVDPACDGVKGDEIEADLGSENDDLRAGARRCVGFERDCCCCCCCCMTMEQENQDDVLVKLSQWRNHYWVLTTMSRTNIKYTGGTQSPPLEDHEPMGVCSISGGNAGGIPDRLQRSRISGHLPSTTVNLIISFRIF